MKFPLLTKVEAECVIDALKPWYHSMPIPTAEGFVVMTPGEPYEAVWNNIRAARAHIDYTGANVLDIASFDGMWAFEAEQLGAKQVIATDCNWRAYPNFLFARQAKNSKVLPLYNVSIYELKSRLDSFLNGHDVCYKKRDTLMTDPRPVFIDPRFDIVHCTGLIYHLRDPLLGLLQCRSVMQDGSKLLLETAYYDNAEPVMVINPVDRSGWCIYDDNTTWWAPTISCLTHMLESSLFKVIDGTIHTAALSHHIGRVALVAEAVPQGKANSELADELTNIYRTPGLT